MREVWHFLHRRGVFPRTISQVALSHVVKQPGHICDVGHQDKKPQSPRPFPATQPDQVRENCDLGTNADVPCCNTRRIRKRLLGAIKRTPEQNRPMTPNLGALKCNTSLLTSHLRRLALLVKDRIKCQKPTQPPLELNAAQPSSTTSRTTSGFCGIRNWPALPAISAESGGGLPVPYAADGSVFYTCPQGEGCSGAGITTT